NPEGVSITEEETSKQPLLPKELVHTLYNQEVLKGFKQNPHLTRVVTYASCNFDPKLSDHFILWELKLLIDFPAASIIIIPSTFSHGNVGLQAGETRYSLIQYSAGGLFHWVKYGFRKWEKFKKDDPKKTRAEWSARPTGWQEVLGLFCNISEFASL
ncbi:hypothetical protein PHLCEN_2v7269, partial [Hermanssonia centrifuga]